MRYCKLTMARIAATLNKNAPILPKFSQHVARQKHTSQMKLQTCIESEVANVLLANVILSTGRHPALAANQAVERLLSQRQEFAMMSLPAFRGNRLLLGDLSLGNEEIKLITPRLQWEIHEETGEI